LSITRPFRDARRFPSTRLRMSRKFGIRPSFKDHFRSPVPNPNDTIRNFLIAVYRSGSQLERRQKLAEVAGPPLLLLRPPPPLWARLPPLHALLHEARRRVAPQSVRQPRRVEAAVLVERVEAAVWVELVEAAEAAELGEAAGVREFYADVYADSGQVSVQVQANSSTRVDKGISRALNNVNTMCH
jgi:hypothetical protein